MRVPLGAPGFGAGHLLRCKRRFDHRDPAAEGAIQIAAAVQDDNRNLAILDEPALLLWLIGMPL